MKTVRNLLFIGIIVFFALGQIGRVGLGDYPIFIHLYEVPLALFTFLVIIHLGRAPLLHPRLKIIHIMAIWMFISLVISAFFYSWYETSIAVLYAFRLSWYVLFGIYVNAYISQASSQYLNYLTWIVYGLIAWFAGTMIIQYFLYSDIGNIAYLGWDPHSKRVVGLFLEPPLAATFLALSMIYLYQNKLLPIYKYISLGVLGILFILTYSRGAFLAGIVTGAYFLLRRKRWVLFGGIIGVTLLGFILLGKSNKESTNMFRTTSIQSRIRDYQEGMEIWSKNIISGIGYNHIRFEKEKYTNEKFVEDYNPSHGIASFHSSFLIIVVTTGIVGLLLSLFGCIQLWGVNAFTKPSVIFLSVISLFDNVFLHPFIILIFILMVTLSFFRTSRSFQA